MFNKKESEEFISEMRTCLAEPLPDADEVISYAVGFGIAMSDLSKVPSGMSDKFDLLRRMYVEHCIVLLEAVLAHCDKVAKENESEE